MEDAKEQAAQEPAVSANPVAATWPVCPKCGVSGQMEAIMGARSKIRPDGSVCIGMDNIKEFMATLVPMGFCCMACSEAFINGVDDVSMKASELCQAAVDSAAGGDSNNNNDKE